MAEACVLDRVVTEPAPARPYPAGHRAWQNGEGPPSNPGTTIALDREDGTTASEVARAVGHLLGWPVYDRELLEQVARELCRPISIRELQAIEERLRSWLMECCDGAVSESTANESGYVHQLSEVIHSLAGRGHCVIIGRGAALILPPRTTFRVLLVGPLDERISAYCRRFHVDRKEAARRIEDADRGQAQFAARHFQKEWALSENYDLVLNTFGWPVEKCAHFIVEAMRSKAIEEGGDAGF